MLSKVYVSTGGIGLFPYDDTDAFSGLCMNLQYGMSELQNLAYQEIVLCLTPKNIVEEAFSSFFAR